ncbi:polymorphic toxin type 15 domain-containing protein [Neorhizobium galegae]|uniref:polymorphic toxin type 15 domain-containing protein n=1 Tax=Neorhizobium galegae TaxID=399 RepID=UPI00351D6299
MREQMASVNATHYLDIIAGGDPRELGIGGGAENQRIGPMWTQGGRAEALRTDADQKRTNGQAHQLMDVELNICGEEH